MNVISVAALDKYPNGIRLPPKSLNDNFLSMTMNTERNKEPHCVNFNRHSMHLGNFLISSWINFNYLEIMSDNIIFDLPEDFPSLTE